MTERNKLLESIAATMADYRAEVTSRDGPSHVERWIKQFGRDSQVPVLRELDHVLKKTYFSRERATKFLDGLVSENALAGKEPCVFWKKATFHQRQENGHSQAELLRIFDDILEEKCGFTTASCDGSGSDHIYLDDAMFTGARVGKDLELWIRATAPKNATARVVVFAAHSFAAFKLQERIAKASRDQKKVIRLEIWRIAEFENKLINRNVSEVLWPSVLPDDDSLRAYIAAEKKFPFQPRDAGGKTAHNLFSSETGRQILEKELLLAGMRIRSFSKNPSPALRPLGFSPFGLGFGSMIVTFRNCPNNCPLALWWGDPDAESSHPFSKWYPLFPRETYGKGVNFDDFPF